MKSYKIAVTEVLYQEITVEAENEKDVALK